MAKGGRLARRAIASQPATAGTCAKPRVGQRLADLQVGVNARLQPAENLQDQAVAESDSWCCSAHCYAAWGPALAPRVSPRNACVGAR